MIDIENYNNNNVFAKILRKEYRQKKFMRMNMHLLLRIFHLRPHARFNNPKKPFCSFDDFLEKADDTFILGFIKSIKLINKCLNIKNGYRLITNVGLHGGQEVPHLHFHLLSGDFSKKLVSS